MSVPRSVVGTIGQLEAQRPSPDWSLTVFVESCTAGRSAKNARNTRHGGKAKDVAILQRLQLFQTNLMHLKKSNQDRAEDSERPSIATSWFEHVWTDLPPIPNIQDGVTASHPGGDNSHCFSQSFFKQLHKATVYEVTIKSPTFIKNHLRGNNGLNINMVKKHTSKNLLKQRKALSLDIFVWSIHHFFSCFHTLLASARTCIRDDWKALVTVRDFPAMGWSQVAVWEAMSIWKLKQAYVYNIKYMISTYCMEFHVWESCI